MNDQQPDPAGQAPAPLPPELVSAILRDDDSPYFPTQIGVFCDNCGVIETADYMVHEDMTRDERFGVARKHLVETKRWTCTPEDGDLCPSCTAASSVDSGREQRPPQLQEALDVMAKRGPVVELTAPAAAPSPPDEEPAACGKCKTPFDPADTRFDGRAQYAATPYCRACVDFCRDTEIADHRCVICA